MNSFAAEDSSFSFGFDFNLGEIESIITNSIPRIDEEDFGDWEEFGFKMDSLASSFRFYYSDSAMKFDDEKLREEIRKVKEELKSIKKKNKN